MKIEFAPDWRKKLEEMDDASRMQARLFLGEMETALLQFPLMAYEPNSADHWQFHLARERYKAIFGGNRSGKTTTGIVDDLFQVCPRELIAQRCPNLMPIKQYDCPAYVRICAPDMKRAMIPVIFEKLRQWMPRELLENGQWKSSYDSKHECLRLMCGCRIDFMSMEMDRDKFGGAALHRVHFDEEPEKGRQTESLWRLIDFNGDAIWCMTPLDGLSHTHRFLWKNRNSLEDHRDSGKYAIAVSIHSNPNVSEAGKAQALAETPPEERRAREYGEFVHMEGMVYPRIVETKCTAEFARQRVESGQEVGVGIDPGITNAGLVWGVFDELNRVTIFHAAKLKNATPQGYAEAIAEGNARWGVKPDFYVIDPAARARSLVNSETVQTELQKYGVFTENGQNDVSAGVLQIRQRIQDRGEAGRWLSINEELTGLWEEAEEYRIEEHADGSFGVVKENDHLMDAKRYLIMSRPWVPDVSEITRAAQAEGVAWGPPKPSEDYRSHAAIID